MNAILSTAGDAGVQSTVIDASGWVILLGGVLLTALWLRSLTR
jgi:hypothetical protein